MPTGNDYNRVNFSDSPREEYGQVNPTDTYPATSTDQVPSEGDPKQAQVSSDVSGDPRDLARESNDSQNAFAELQQFLNNNLPTPGSRVYHPQDKPYRPPHGAEGE